MPVSLTTGPRIKVVMEGIRSLTQLYQLAAGAVVLDGQVRRGGQVAVLTVEFQEQRRRLGRATPVEQSLGTQPPITLLGEVGVRVKPVTTQLVVAQEAMAVTA